MVHFMLQANMQCAEGVNKHIIASIVSIIATAWSKRANEFIVCKSIQSNFIFVAYNFVYKLELKKSFRL